jgi:hypothetical protein
LVIPLETTIKDFLTVRREGSRGIQRKLTYYNLNMIISVGYRIKSLIVNQYLNFAEFQARRHQWVQLKALGLNLKMDSGFRRNDGQRYYRHAGLRSGIQHLPNSFNYTHINGKTD